jgi:hypothetical protein
MIGFAGVQNLCWNFNVNISKINPSRCEVRGILKVRPIRNRYQTSDAPGRDLVLRRAMRKVIFKCYAFIIINSIIVLKSKFETGSTPASLTKLAFDRDQVYIATSN